MVNVWTSSLERPWWSVNSGKLFAGGERQCVQQNWILFSSEVLTALLIQQFLGTFTPSQKASIAFIMSVCLSVWQQVSSRFTLGESMWNLFHENILQNSGERLLASSCRISKEFNIWVIFERLSRTVKFSLTHWGREGSFKLFKRPFPGFF